MADATAPTAEDRALDALSKVLEASVAPETLEIQRVILRRLALSGSLFPSRMPAPLNITQVGGYLNLLQDLPEMKLQVLASTLGVAGPELAPDFLAPSAPIAFEPRPNDRPAGTSQPTIPLTFTVRADFAAPLDAALAALHDLGGALPLLTPARVLPPAGPNVAPPTDILPLLGRTLDAVPAAALNDPLNDPLALGGAGSAAPQVLARQINAAASNAASVTASAWNLWQCTTMTCTQVAVTGAYIPVYPLLQAAGWYQGVLSAPASLAAPGPWNRWINVTGLVTGQSRLGDELRLLYSAYDVAESSVASILDYRWDGIGFVP